MGFFRKLIKNLLPYYAIKKYRVYKGGKVISRDYDSIKSQIEEIKNQNNNLLAEIAHINNWMRNEQIKPSWISLYESDLSFAPGGFYSPIPSIQEIYRYDFNSLLPDELPGIDLNVNKQLNLLESFEPLYKELPFPEEKSEGFRYYYVNGFYSYSDAILLYCMIRHLNPKKIIEIGSGFSSCVTLDTNEIFMKNSINCTFIEPYPERLESLLKKDDNATIYKKRLQEMPIEIFEELAKDDILFIDSTHVAKFNSDVNFVIHKILPVLANGVYIHFHDVFYPFEYPNEWLLEGRAWNEQYILRAFLEYNNDFEIVLFNTYLENKYEKDIKKRFPLLYKNTGSSIWIKKIP